MRISEQHKYWTATQRIEKAKNQNIESLNQLSSQKRVNFLHDDPNAAARMIKEKDRITELTSYQNNISFSRGFISTSENAISTVSARLARAQELAIAMSNDSNGPETRSITAEEIKSIVSELIELGNSKYNSKFVFSGLRSDAPAFDSDGLYLGDDGDLFIQTDVGQYKKINISGRDLYEVSEDEKAHGHFNMVENLISLQAGLEKNDKDIIHRSLSELDYQINKASSLQAKIGAVSTSLEDIDRRLVMMTENEKTRLSEAEDVDVYQASSDFKRTEAVLQSTLMASNKLLQPSLLNFMQ